MPSDLLIETIAMLKQRIEIRGEYLSRNEVPTRQLLIDPMLRALGWDFEDTDRVSLEHRVKHGRIDYALLIDGVPRVAIEAKRLGTGLDDRVRRQAYGYASQSGIKYALMTDGNVWRMFDATVDPRLPECVVMDVCVGESNPDVNANEMDVLSHSALEEEMWVRVPI